MAGEAILERDMHFSHTPFHLGPWHTHGLLNGLVH